MIYDSQRDPTLSNRNCKYCDIEISYTNNIPEGVILFCNDDCYDHQTMEDE